MAACYETIKEAVRDPRTGEAFWRIKHKSGLLIQVFEMEGYSSAHAIFGTKYGSINTTFKTVDDKDFVTVPEGIAHFLEHKLFENEDCDVFELYGKTGASANAATSFDRTYYLFTCTDDFNCTDNFNESLKILLDFVQKPYFTNEKVAKEQGIIGQEIRMYEDMASWRVFFNLLIAMYHNNPVRIDIAGTIESIAKIDADLLYKCYNTFYNLHNMSLAIAGNVSVEEVISICDELLKPCDDMQLETKFPDEPEDVAQKFISLNLEVSLPLFNIGFKMTPVSGLDLVKTACEASMVLDLLADESSPLYQRLYEKGLINSSFSSEILSGEGFFAGIISGESTDPQAVLKEVIEAVEDAKKNGLDKSRFDIVKKSGYGENIAELNNIVSVATLLLNSAMEGVSPFDYLDVAANVTYEDVQNRLSSFNTENVALSVVMPK